jgi:hypothetical protein
MHTLELNPSKKEDQRPPMTGTMDEIGYDLKRIKNMGVRACNIWL